MTRVASHSPVAPDDRQRICEALYQYALGIDTRDWVAYRRIFADEIAIDFSSYSGRAPSIMSADQWVASVRPLFTGLAATQHTMTNPIVTLDADDAATCVMYMQAAHALEPNDDNLWFTIGGYYTDRLQRTTDGWKISGVTLTVLWRRGDPAIMVTAAQRGAASLAEPASTATTGESTQ